MSCMTRMSFLLRRHAARNFSGQSGVSRKHQKPGDQRRRGTKDMNGQLPLKSQRHMGEADQFIPDDEEVSFFLPDKMAGAVQREYRRVRAHMNWNEARRAVERGPQEPNLLTAAQKLELRRLAADDPAHWRPQRLAAAFNLSSSAVIKLLKSHWQPTTPEEVEKHDRRVAARRRALGLPVYSADRPAATPATPNPVARRRGPMTALLSQFSRPSVPDVHSADRERQNVVSAVYQRKEVLQFPVSDTVGEDDSEMRRLDAQIDLPKTHMTLDELKRMEKSMERKSKLRITSRRPGSAVKC
ncbi:uncharacterized protein LOC119103565 [Pollicipes pollicipes]|uniref:uncharacterized protein LOC119103565 n=1 Tax=Pollicipes pollicipes TaxID=41117 RepID=UPI001885099B|nr:uncharacterized protein LOC119103565 [Pollicipes pollicipes]XP_037083042.1 uncharacterized protein LOC119103565 [Pollicipes pollicipes]XP_037083043.1 uncharacterized protein LOC119103565 [Pollicipes pollicipes]XP_037083044.1 uncharacterized protein LOC119103565 [Pollicipes pollicipes]XP_037083045.1 uncharacterized protein LOC119103565 [Pollicipes pollicipes]XP_037083046.1 uncharacterized protein LOC119103565 [Pollicipes pollicipes]